mmetsp:Transcript_53333/g.106065  ORF Transcript_53333/g.106065 Transcript_53333/m.106065 type:complete len:389 (-) Transcript_53333:304-1470(-)
MSRVRSVNVRKDDTRKMEEDARRMEAKLEILRRTVDPTEPTKTREAGRWRSGAQSKPLTKGYVRSVLEAPPRTSGKPRSGTQPKASSIGRAIEADTGPLVQAFLAGLNLDRYVSIFMENGFDCMEVVQEMQENHMKDIGMAAGHILKLRKRLAELSPQPSEGKLASSMEVQRRHCPVSTGTERRVSFGGSESKEASKAATSLPGGGTLLNGGAFDEAESAASFQEALRAWREGCTDDSVREPAGRVEGRGAANVSLHDSGRISPGSFWSNLGTGEMDLSHVTTPVPTAKPSTAQPAQAEVQRSPVAGEEKVCCYQCFKQLYAKYAILRDYEAPDLGGKMVARRLCSESCAERLDQANQVKAEAQKKRQETLEKLQQMEQGLCTPSNCS